MKKLFVLGLLFLATDAYAQVIPSDVINSWGYQEKKTNYLLEYCRGEWQPSSSEYQGIKSLRLSTELPEARYRFTLGKELYAQEAEAIKRLKALQEPGERNSKQKKLCDIKQAIRIKNAVYFVHSDVAVFRAELKSIFDKLRAYLTK